MQFFNQILFATFFPSFLHINTIAKEWTREFKVDNSDSPDNLKRMYVEAASRINSDEQQFLKELLAADEAILEGQTRGIVDQILATISNGGAGVLGPIVGTGSATPPNVSTIPSPTNSGVINNNQQRNVSAPGQGTPNNDNHLFSQISQVLVNSVSRNVTGIVDNALRIGTPAPIRDLVNGIVAAAYCNGIRRLLGRC